MAKMKIFEKCYWTAVESQKIVSKWPQNSVSDPSGAKSEIHRSYLIMPSYPA